jgi:hypothetical protein
LEFFTPGLKDTAPQRFFLSVFEISRLCRNVLHSPYAKLTTTRNASE